MNLKELYGENCNESFQRNRIEKLKAIFKQNESCKPEKIFSSSGRAEILGNHTDHNHGLVMVAAISCDILAAVKKTDDRKIKICSENYAPILIDLNDTAKKENESGTSAALTRGIAEAIKSRGFIIGGFTAYLTSDIFKGAGVSSSAAYEVLIAEILNNLYLDEKLSSVDKAVISQYAENVYFGKPCGLLDQSGIAIGSLSMLDFNVPDNPIIREICRQLEAPLLSTTIPYDENDDIEYLTNPELIEEKLGDDVDMVIDGGIGGYEYSTVVYCVEDEFEIIRQGKGTLI